MLYLDTMLLNNELISFIRFNDWLSSILLREKVVMSLNDKTGNINLEILVRDGRGLHRNYYRITNLTPSVRTNVLALADEWTISYGIGGKPKKNKSTKSRK